MQKPKKGEKIRLHEWIARGGKPADFEGCAESATEEKAEDKKPSDDKPNIKR